LLAIIGAAVVLLGAGVFVGVRALLYGVDDAIPQADLFGDGTPSGSPSPAASPTPAPGADIKGPINILLVGVDTREDRPSWMPHADAVMILHVTKDLSRAYLTSLPRDLVVNVPAFAPARFGGARTKLTHAMSYGSRVPGSSRPKPTQGFQLVARTVSNYTGIARFDAGALLTFNGYRKLVDALGGVDLYVDQRVVSIHRRPDGHHRPSCAGCSHGYSGPQAVYAVGTRHLVGWQALDYARQRYVPGGDYTRQRHQRQLIKAMVAKALRGDLLRDPIKFTKVVRALGSTLVFDGRGRKPVEFAFALRNLRAESITSVGLPGGSVYSGGQYRGESLGGVKTSYFAALRQDRIDAWVKSHSNLVNPDPR
jgi:LCP family protein required for cell wall assembly